MSSDGHTVVVTKTWNGTERTVPFRSFPDSSP